MVNKILFVDGARNVGKTYLISNIDKTNYKFPFNDIIIDLAIDKNDSKLFYLTFGYNITLLDMVKKGIINNIVVDRGILSDIVFGLQSGRITMDEAIRFWNIINSKYGDYFNIINIKAEYTKDTRSKDNWVYNAIQTEHITNTFLKNVNHNVLHFFNHKQKTCVDRFKIVVNSFTSIY